MMSHRLYIATPQYLQDLTRLVLTQTLVFSIINFNVAN